MSWANGVYTRTNGTFSGSTVWTEDEGANFGVESGRHDNHDQNIAEGLNACIELAGDSQMNTALAMNSLLITGLRDPVVNGEMVNMGYSDIFLDADPSLADQSMGNKRVRNLVSSASTDLATKGDFSGVAANAWGYVTSGSVIKGGSGNFSAGNPVSFRQIDLTFDDAASSPDNQVVLVTMDVSGKASQPTQFKYPRVAPYGSSVTRIYMDVQGSVANNTWAIYFSRYLIT
jgi:hypothetical protein